MTSWKCCRMCLSVEGLHPIFAKPKFIKKYTEVIFYTTGVKIKPTDALPQDMCTRCVYFINSSHKFRKKCDESQRILLRRLNETTEGSVKEIKIESVQVKVEAVDNFIDVSDIVVDANLHNVDHITDKNGNNDILELMEDINLPNDSEIIAGNGNNDILDIGDDINMHDDSIFSDPNDITQERPVTNVGMLGDKDINNKQKGSDNYGNNDHVATGSTENTKRVEIEIDSRPTDTVEDAIEKPIQVIVSERTNLQLPVRKPVRSNTSSGEVQERAREEIECEYCHKVLTSRLSLRNHYKIHTGFDVVCEHCGKKFITRRLLLMHCRAKHGYEKTDKCSYCDYRASNAEQVKIHERLHTGEKPFVCSTCGAGFHRKSSYLQHVAIHLPEKTIQCDLCHARFKSVTLMRIHRHRHRDIQYWFKCRVCDNSFVRRRNVARHLQRMHGLEPTNEHIERVKINQ